MELEEGMKIKVIAAAAAIGLGACAVEQTREGEAPEIEVEEGQLPQYEVEPADVDVGWDTTEVRVPRIDVQPRNDTVRDTIR